MVSVLLNVDVDGMGEKGSIVKVKPSYAENVLVSKGKGTVASKATLERIAKEMEEAAAAAKAQKDSAVELRSTLLGKFGDGLKTEVQVGKDGVLLTSFTGEEVASELKRLAGISIEPSLIEMPEVTEVGSVMAEVTLHPEVTLSLKVAVEKSKITLG